MRLKPRTRGRGAYAAKSAIIIGAHFMCISTTFKRVKPLSIAFSLGDDYC